MPNYNISVPASSPFIRYPSGVWTFSATNATCYLAQNTTNSVDLAFDGMGIYLRGDPTDNFAVTASGTMDGQKVLAQINGTPPYALPDHNNSVVFAQEGLSFSSHVLSLSYGVSTPVLVPNSGFAVTGVEITMGDGDESTPPAQLVTIEDTDDNIKYSPGTHVLSSAMFNSGTATILNTSDGFANISFWGNDVAVYGALLQGKSQCAYSVSLDQQAAQLWPARTNVTADVPRVLLYQTGNLTHDSHYVLIRANCSTETPLLLDYVEARTHITVMSATGIVVPQPTQTSTATSTETLTSATQSPTPSAAIAGGVLGSLALIAVAVTCAFYLLRRRFRRTRFTFVGEDGIDGGDLPARPEEDMPPPDYQRIFARGSGVMRPHANARGRQRNPSDVHPSALRRFFGGKRQRDRSPAHPETSEIQHLLADIAEPATARHPPLPRPGTDPSLLAWKGQLPVDDRKKSSKLGAFNWRSGLSQK